MKRQKNNGVQDFFIGVIAIITILECGALMYKYNADLFLKGIGLTIFGSFLIVITVEHFRAARRRKFKAGLNRIINKKNHR